MKYQFMPRLSDEEYAELEASIIAHGVLVDIVQDEHGDVIDGHHRKAIAEKHGIPYGVDIRYGTDAELRTVAYELNLHRRHLDRDQRRKLIEASLASDPQLSDRQHAERTGSSHPTVGAVRSEMVADGRLENLSSRTSADGRERPATQPQRPDNVDTNGEFVESDPAPPSGIERPAETPTQPDADDVDEEREMLAAIAAKSTTVAERHAMEIGNAISSARRALLHKHTDAELAIALSDNELAEFSVLARSLLDRAQNIRKARPVGLRVVQGGQR